VNDLTRPSAIITKIKD